MSKSIGNVVDPNDVINQYNSDTFRYYCIREGNFGSDINYSYSSLEGIYDSDLADIYGNLVNRALSLPEKWFDSKVPDYTIEPFFDIQELITKSKEEFNNLRINAGLGVIMDYFRLTNKYIADKAPWKIKGENALREKGEILRTVMEALYILNHFIHIIIPNAATKVFECLGKAPIPINQLTWQNLVPGDTVTKCDILFKRIRDPRHLKKVEGEM